MNSSEALDIMRLVLREIAPEVDLADCGPTDSIQESLDLDSIDFLNFVTGLHERTGVDIPESEYGKVSTPEGCASFLVAGSGRSVLAAGPPPIMGRERS